MIVNVTEEFFMFFVENFFFHDCMGSKFSVDLGTGSEFCGTSGSHGTSVICVWSWVWSMWGLPVGRTGGVILSGKCGREFGLSNPARSCGLNPEGKCGWGRPKLWNPGKLVGGKPGSENGGIRDIGFIGAGFACIPSKFGFCSNANFGSVFIPTFSSINGIWPFSSSERSSSFSDNLSEFSSKSFGPRIPAFRPCLAISSLWCRSWWTLRFPRQVEA